MALKKTLTLFFAGFFILTGCSDKSSYNPLRIKALRELVTYFKVYSAQDHNGPLLLKRIGRDYDGGYVVAEKSLRLADVLLGYGIADDISFEETFSNLYGKPSYGFDGGAQEVKSKNKLFTFVRECIASDEFLYKGQNSSGKVSTFSQQVSKLGLKNKKIFIKMDIEGAEYEAFPDILRHHSKNVTGIVLELHFKSLASIKKAIKLLSDINEEFLLVHVHGNNAGGARFSTQGVSGKIPYLIELTYINRNLITGFEVLANQKHPQAIDMINVPSMPEAEFEIPI